MQAGRLESGQNVTPVQAKTPERRRPLYALASSSGLFLVVLLGPQRLERDPPVIGRTEFPPGTAPTRPSFSPPRQPAPVHHPVPINTIQGLGRDMVHLQSVNIPNVQKVNTSLSSSSDTPLRCLMTIHRDVQRRRTTTVKKPGLPWLWFHDRSSVHDGLKILDLI